ncbi:hypothetical protein CEY16_00725 [Halalkalibacillus sediminis]|uniref:DUF2157 domain-containing protein n=1 Tax=Halalkalibacillus sediminis TaxID=2018042 RepID=A0A2I0QVG1_9BACI|nr:DUF2157 domain-containing protein [Halalkalibacillus sediminis]PKR78315.1 hypothetical protein CEY16_00725 [Halalkalibacillus sediminis]
MKFDWLKNESKKWVEEGVIESHQREKILSRYPKKDSFSLIFFFAAILIGLAFLTFIAANWSGIPQFIRMAIIIGFLLFFYGLGEYFFKRSKPLYGLSCYIISICVFGAGIFLSGQMYHFSMENVFSFFIWGFAAYLIYVSRPHISLFSVGMVIVTVGQLYGIISLRSFDWWLFALFIIGYGTVVFNKGSAAKAWMFATAFLLQMLAFSLEQQQEYYWFILFVLLIYVAGEVFKRASLRRPFQHVAALTMFVVVIIQGLFFDEGFARDQVLPIDNSYYLYFIPLISIAIILTQLRKKRSALYQLALFFPVFIWVDAAALLSYLVLYVFSVGMLLQGYHKHHPRLIQFGMIAFLISTCIVYFQVAWNFLDKSLFFLLGGIVLFAIGYFLDRQRREVIKNEREDG